MTPAVFAFSLANAPPRAVALEARLAMRYQAAKSVTTDFPGAIPHTAFSKGPTR
ncbi:hypothetical protein [Tropicibacter naphthalenivorans]|uniref:Uncharacterized protein n=1 Tax=Tropicibacter naphthalenivorans TaxID=441103 RepID=A0A0P1GVG1_9RHOB|nr:hypothetical protein [Tropicibacter naphthalenivorans]CUH79437.1 hypothetical protein TRN7648_02470 [Tropicibacter naphthalenivorans]SMC72232.1 hypothetical protein SAMN04488093_103100 [Tropicibacter naphthalenivorans]